MKEFKPQEVSLIRFCLDEMQYEFSEQEKNDYKNILKILEGSPTQNFSTE
tara:strand:+ start:219 stop:368 length:150 start_codon:yes stop_codon:yes gene_type:complete